MFGRFVRSKMKDTACSIYIGEHRAENGHIQQHAADRKFSSLAAQREPHHEHDGEPDNGVTIATYGVLYDMCVGGREVSSPRERTTCRPMAKNNRVEAGDQTDQRDQTKQHGSGVAV